MRSAFSRSNGRRITATARPHVDEAYDLSGLNQIAPDQVMPKGETPFTINSRRFAKNESETRVAIRTRRGSINYSTPVGEIVDSDTLSEATTSVQIDEEQQVAFSFEVSAEGSLTKMAINLKRGLSAGGYGIVTIHTDKNNLPGLVIATSSFKSSDVSTEGGSTEILFMDAPKLTVGATYWCTVKLQRLSTGHYELGAKTGNTTQSSSSDGATWVSSGVEVVRKLYLSEHGNIKGQTRRNPSDKRGRTMFALGSKIYAVPDNPTVPEVVYSSLHPDVQKVRFAHVDDLTFWCDSIGALQQWDGDEVSVVPGAPVGVSNLIIFKNRLMVVPSDDPTAVRFTALYDWKKWPSVNFFYVPRPKSPDPITAWIEFQDNLVIFTHETKHILFGSDISTFTRKEAIGTKGAYSQEAVAVDRNKVYFMADDNMIYTYNGATDELISGKVEPELRTANPRSVTMHIYRNQLRVYYEVSATGERNMLLYDIEQQQWFKDTGRNVLASLELTLNDNELIEFSSEAGWLFQGETGLSDLGKPIDFKYWTSYKIYGSGASKSRIKRFRPVVRPADSRYYLQVGRDIDFNDRPDMRDWLVDSGGAVWGSFAWGDGTKYGGKKLLDNPAAMSGRGKHIQYRFEHCGVDQPVELYGYISLVKIGRPR